MSPRSSPSRAGREMRSLSSVCSPASSPSLAACSTPARSSTSFRSPPSASSSRSTRSSDASGCEDLPSLKPESKRQTNHGHGTQEEGGHRERRPPVHHRGDRRRRERAQLLHVLAQGHDEGGEVHTLRRQRTP